MCMCVCVCMSQDIGVRGWCECVSHVWRWDLWVCGWAGVDVLVISLTFQELSWPH